MDWDFIIQWFDCFIFCYQQSDIHIQTLHQNLESMFFSLLGVQSYIKLSLDLEHLFLQGVDIVFGSLRRPLVADIYLPSEVCKNKGGYFRNSIWAYEIIISCDIACLFINGIW